MSWNNVIPAWLLDEQWADTLKPDKIRVRAELAKEGKCNYCRPHRGENASKPRGADRKKNPRRR